MQTIANFKNEYMETILTGEPLEKYRKKALRKSKTLANVSYAIYIIVKAVTTPTGRRMAEWEEIAATSMAVENFHLQLTSRWESGVGGYWSSGGKDTYFKHSKGLRKLLGANSLMEDGTQNDLILGCFYVGHCPPSKMNKYRSSRGDISEKVKWME